MSVGTAAIATDYQAPAFSVAPGLCLVAFGLMLLGCGSEPGPPASTTPTAAERPLRALRAAIREQQWERAWQLSDAVLQEYPEDADVLAKLALVAHENEMPERAAELLVASCRAESFKNQAKVLQTMIAMVRVGRLHDGMVMLEQAVREHPDQHETRRWLYDFYMGTEDREAGLPHGRYLVRQRQFDLELLLTLSNTERRTQDAKPLDEMTSRNPDDKRPLLGVAKTQFDEGRYKEAIATLETITAAHPAYLPAQSMLGRVLASAGDFDRVETWAEQAPANIETYCGYWIALGDWARGGDQPARAARCYWEATRRDPDVMEAWAKLATTLDQLRTAGEPVDQSVVAAIRSRAERLSKFSQLKNRFDRTGKISRAIAIEIAQLLAELGRLWEAEAWASITLTLPEDESVPAAEVRRQIVSKLDPETAWQTTSSDEFKLDLTNLALPDIARSAASSPEESADNSKPDAGPPPDQHPLSLVNEAAQRGVDFFGRTSDTLDQPGIMLYQTLGCGGGAVDYDLDGWPDLYLIAAGGTPPNRDSDPNALFHNRGGKFAEVTATSSAGDRGFGQGVAVGDVNEDGFADLLVLNYGPNTLLINNGDGTFSDHSEQIGPAADWSTSAAIADLDNDGLSDIVVVNYCAGLEPVTVRCPVKETNVHRSCSPVQFPAQPDLFLRSRGNGDFVDHTDAWKARPDIVGRGLGIVAGSFDHIPGIDLLIANDMTNNHYWSSSPVSLNEPQQRGLTESAVLRGLAGDDRALAQGSMGIASADLDGDGRIDFYVTNFHQEYNTYYLQRSPGIWRDETAPSGLAAPTMKLVGFGTEAVDLDNDGWFELILTNGHVDIFSRSDERAVYAQPMQLFRRAESGQYDSIGETLPGEYFANPHVGRALWTLDANRDGRTDVAVTHQTEPLALLMNRSANNGDWIELALVGTDSPRDAIGATVELRCGKRTWVASQTSGDGYLCTNERRIRIGLGTSDTEVEVTVTWLDGSRQSFAPLQPNQRWLIVENADEPFGY